MHVTTCTPSHSIYIDASVLYWPSKLVEYQRIQIITPTGDYAHQYDIVGKFGKFGELFLTIQIRSYN